jgi:hypothetical protein
LLDELRRFVKEHERLPSNYELSTEYGYPSSTLYSQRFGGVQNALYEAGLLSDNPEIDPNFFNIDKLNPHKWYIIGLLIASSYMKKKGDIFLSFDILNVDHLEIFRNELNIMNKSYPECMNIETSCKIRFRNISWNKDLEKFGIVPEREEISFIPYECCVTDADLAGLILGIFERKGVMRIIDNIIEISICGSERSCINLKEVLEIVCNCNIPLISRIDVHSGDKFEIRIQGFQNCQNLYNLLYQPELKDIWLERKRLTFETLLKQTKC